MLYDGALKFMGTARDAIERRDIPARRDALSRTLAIISELQSTLNLAEGGQVAAELDRLYSYSNSRLLEAAMKNDVAPIDDVKRVFEILRDGWNIIATQPVGALAAIAMQPMASARVIGDDAAQMLAQYRAGLEAQIALLRQLEAVASHQRTVSESRDFERLAIESDRRDSLTRSLVEIEQGLAAGLRVLGASRQSVARLEGLSEVIALRRTTANLIARILATDQLSLQSLANAELARRSALASLERGETTLAAYRKILAPPVASAAFFDRLGVAS